MTENSSPFTSDTYVQRRKLLCNAMPDCHILLLGNDIAAINFKDNGYRFRQDSTFLYYIGVNTPNLAAIIDTGKGTTTLFGQEADIDNVIWTGPQASLRLRAEHTGITEVKPLNSLPDHIVEGIHYLPAYRGTHTLKLFSLLVQKKLKPSLSLIKAIVQQRNIKSSEEIAEMEKAVHVSNMMHKHVMNACRSGLSEYHLVAEATHFALSHKVHLAYNPIITINGQILHNHNHDNELTEGKMVLNDSGVELSSGYCGDITRTFPVGPTFSVLQKEIYQVVYNAYIVAREVAKPGNKFLDAHLATAKSMVDDLKAMGWMKGDSEAAVAAGAHTLFFQHGLGHMLGMDVHDMENLGEQYVGYESPHEKFTEFGLKSLRLAMTLEAGNCITIEPGVYIIPELIKKREAEGAYKEYINYDIVNKYHDAGGIRLEDDFVITSDGNRLLSDTLPLDIESIEAMRQG